MPDRVKRLLNFNEIVDQVFLAKQVFFYDQSYIDDLFSVRSVQCKICSVVLLPVISPACSPASISSAFLLSLFKMTRIMILLG